MTPLITLIPNSGTQFVDLDLDLEQLPRLSRSFWEEPVGGEASVLLRGLADDGAGMLSVVETGAVPPTEEIYSIGRNQAIEMHVNRWGAAAVLSGAAAQCERPRRL